MDFRFLERFEPQLLAVLRIITALLFAEHALIKLIGFPPGGPPGLQPVGNLFWIGGVVEIVCSLMVLLGLWTRLFAFLAAGEMAIGYFMIHFPKSFFPAVNMGEGAILYCFIFLYIAAAGPGAWSIDGARTKNAPIR